MKPILLCLSILTLASPAFAKGKFPVGAQVLAKCGYDLERATVTDEHHSEDQVKFVDPVSESVCGGTYFDEDELLAYQSVRSLTYSNWFGMSAVTFNIGDQVVAKCGYDRENAIIIDLAHKGYAKIKFAKSSSDSVCGKRDYHSLSDLEKK